MSLDGKFYADLTLLKNQDLKIIRKELCMVAYLFIGIGTDFSVKFMTWVLTMSVRRPMLTFPFNIITTFYVPYHEHN